MFELEYTTEYRNATRATLAAAREEQSRAGSRSVLEDRNAAEQTEARRV